MSRQKATQKIIKPPQESHHMRPYLLGTFALIIFISVVFISWFIVGSEIAKNKVHIPQNVDELIDNLDNSQRIPLGSFQVNMNTEWTFPSSRSTSANATVSNYIGNTHMVYFTITPKDSEEVFYTSPTLPIGATLENITLDCELEPGVHDTILTYHLIEADGQEYTTLSVDVKITILN